MGNLFISYRRDDSAGLAGRIFDRLKSHFGGDSVFMDVDSIPYGVDFRQHLSEAVGKCDVLLAVIGDQWLTIEEGGRRRLDDPNDFVRIEIETALARGIPVIPVLIGRTPMPKESELPPSMGDFAYKNAAPVDSGPDFHPHVDRLIRKVEDLFPLPKTAALSADGKGTETLKPSHTTRRNVKLRTKKTDPTPFLGYLDREMTNMLGLSVFSFLLGVAAVGFALAFDDVWAGGQAYVIAGASTAFAAGILFFTQRSHLAWLYGQIQLTQSRRDRRPDELEQWLSDADTWDTWVRYRTGWLALGCSVAWYAYGIAAASSGPFRTVPVIWSLYAPLGLMLGVAALQWYLLTKFSQADDPLREWLRVPIAAVAAICLVGPPGAAMVTNWVSSSHISHARMGDLQPGIDFHGSDYANDYLPLPTDCSRKCAEDERCKAITFIWGPGHASGQCYLKHSVPTPSPNSDMVSAVKLD